MNHRLPLGPPKPRFRPPSPYRYFRLALESTTEFGRACPLRKKEQVLVENVQLNLVEYLEAHFITQAIEPQGSIGFARGCGRIDQGTHYVLRQPRLDDKHEIITTILMDQFRQGMRSWGATRRLAFQEGRAAHSLREEIPKQYRNIQQRCLPRAISAGKHVVCPEFHSKLGKATIAVCLDA